MIPFNIITKQNITQNLPYLIKQRRCTYFNAEIDFAHFLESISEALEECDREERGKLLEENVQYANKCLPRGLYIPIAQSASTPHKSLLRIIPNEGKCLPSKQKVPFMIFCEIKKHDYATSSPKIIEELEESDTTLLEGSGKYVLIDEINSNSNSNSKSQIINENKFVETFNNLSIKTNEELKEEKNDININDELTQQQQQQQPRISRKISLHNPNAISPKPKEIDSNAEQLMRNHLEALKAFEPENHKMMPNTIKKMHEKHHLQATTSMSNLRVTKSDPIKTSTKETIDEEEVEEEEEEENNENDDSPSITRTSTSSSSKIELHGTRTEPNSDVDDNDDNVNDINDIRDAIVNTNIDTTNTISNIDRNRNNQDRNKNRDRRRDLSPSLSTKSNPVRGYTSTVHRHDNGNSDKKNINNDTNEKKDDKTSNSRLKTNHHHHHHHSHNNHHNHHKHHNRDYNHSHLKKVRGSSLRWTDPFGEPWDKKKHRIYKTSPFKFKYDNWDLQSLIFKSGEDMRQEQLAMQFIQLFQKIFDDAKLPLQLRTYSVIVSSPASGFVETIPNAVSISGLKHSIKNFVSLRRFFEQFYGPPTSPSFRSAQKNFVESMAAYSLVCYFLQIKDRHNGNILLDSEGKVIHIDFDFILSNSPGGNINFESSPFKLTEEFIEIMGGEQKSEAFDYFQILMIRGFLEARKHYRKFILLVKFMLEGAPMPCFHGGASLVDSLKSRFALHLKNEKCVEHVYSLIEESSCNWRTIQYDKFQKITNDIW